MKGIVTKILPKKKKTGHFNQPVFLQKIIRRSRFPDDNRQSKSQLICSNLLSIGSKFLQQFVSM